jgi:hypothetical protein
MPTALKIVKPLPMPFLGPPSPLPPDPPGKLKDIDFSGDSPLEIDEKFTPPESHKSHPFSIIIISK